MAWAPTATSWRTTSTRRSTRSTSRRRRVRSTRSARHTARCPRAASTARATRDGFNGFLRQRRCTTTGASPGSTASTRTPTPSAWTQQTYLPVLSSRYRPLPYGTSSVSVYTDEHGEANVNFVPGLGMYFDNLVANKNLNNGCDLEGVDPIGKAQHQRRSRAIRTSPSRSQAIGGRSGHFTVHNLFKKTLTAYSKGVDANDITSRTRSPRSSSRTRRTSTARRSRTSWSAGWPTRTPRASGSSRATCPLRPRRSRRGHQPRSGDTRCSRPTQDPWGIGRLCTFTDTVGQHGHRGLQLAQDERRRHRRVRQRGHPPRHARELRDPDGRADHDRRHACRRRTGDLARAVAAAAQPGRRGLGERPGDRGEAAAITTIKSKQAKQLKKVLHKIRFAKVVTPFHGKAKLQVRVNGKAGMVELRITIVKQREDPRGHPLRSGQPPDDGQEPHHSGEDRQGDGEADRPLVRTARPGYAGEARYGGPPPPPAPDTTSAAANASRSTARRASGQEGEQCEWLQGGEGDGSAIGGATAAVAIGDLGCRRAGGADAERRRTLTTGNAPHVTWGDDAATCARAMTIAARDRRLCAAGSMRPTRSDRVVDDDVVHRHDALRATARYCYRVTGHYGADAPTATRHGDGLSTRRTPAPPAHDRRAPGATLHAPVTVAVSSSDSSGVGARRPRGLGGRQSRRTLVVAAGNSVEHPLAPPTVTTRSARSAMDAAGNPSSDVAISSPSTTRRPRPFAIFAPSPVVGSPTLSWTVADAAACTYTRARGTARRCSAPVELAAGRIPNPRRSGRTPTS